MASRKEGNNTGKHEPEDRKTLDLGNAFVLSAGTVTIDPISNKILLLFYRPKSEHLLPKGRKDQGESLDEAAIRETFEESGYRCTLKAHHAPTKAHPTSKVGTGLSATHMEPIACQQRFAYGARKIIFWYLAVGNATDVKIEGTQEEGEDFDSMWVDVEQGLSMLAYEDDRQIANLAAKTISELNKEARKS